MDWVWNAVESIRNGNMNPSIIAEQAATLVINRLQPMFKDILLTQEVAGTSLTKAKRPGRKPLARKLDENGNEVNFEKIDIVVVNANDKVRRYKSLSTGNIYIALTDFLDAINLKESSGEIREFLLTDLIFNIQGDIKMLSKAQMFKIWRFLHLDRNNRRIMAKKLFA
jgi:hypothetical protein